jgi:hypothetical protein
LLLIDRDPWGLALYTLTGGQLIRAADCDLQRSERLTSEVLGFTFGLIAESTRPRVEVQHGASGRTWPV